MPSNPVQPYRPAQSSPAFQPSLPVQPSLPGHSSGLAVPGALSLSDAPHVQVNAQAHAQASALAEVEAGLDALQTSAQAGKRRRASAVTWRILAPIIAAAVLIFAWQVYVWSGAQPLWRVPGPVQVVEALGQAWESGNLQLALRTSLERTFVAFLLSIAISTPLGLLLGQVAWLRRSLGPLITGWQILPAVAWVPAAIMWFGLTGQTVYFVVLMSAIPAMTNGLINAVDQVPPLLKRVGVVLGAGRLDMVTRIILPAALPGYLAGVKQGWALSWRSLMAGEVIAVGGGIGFGLGTLLQQGRDFSQIAAVMAAIVVILLVGMTIEAVVFAPVERRVLGRRGLAKS